MSITIYGLHLIHVIHILRYNNEYCVYLVTSLGFIAAHATCQSRIWLNISSTYMSETPPISSDYDFFTLHLQMWLVDIVDLVRMQRIFYFSNLVTNVIVIITAYGCRFIFRKNLTKHW